MLNRAARQPTVDGTSYRPDIEGLRAVAVSAVVAYHLAPTALPGGYLGVDLFFVLSGYLITGILWREAGAGGVSIGRFYERRLRRIGPALVATIAVTMAVACVVLLPVDLIGLGRSVLATLAFVSNIYFWRDTDYFSRAAMEKPLLHTWSLGIEEQFYLLFPLLIAGTARFGRAPTVALIAATTLASLAGAAVARHIGADLPAFYLLPTRAWELGAGALLVFAPAAAGRIANIAAAAGLALLLASLGMADALLPPPVPVALPVVLATVLLVWSGAAMTAVARGLAVAPLRFLGRISYSLYLIHWPLIVLATYWLVRPLHPAEIAAAVGAMIVLASLSWRFVEQPFRDRRTATRTVVIGVGLAALALAGAAAGLVASRGLPGRLDPAAARINAAAGTNYRCPVGDYLAFGASRACALTGTRDPARADVVLLGNSHAQMYAPLVAGLLRERGLQGLLVPANGCLPTPDVNTSADCARVAATNLGAVTALTRAQIVILGFEWQAIDEPLVGVRGPAASGPAAAIRAIDDLVHHLRAAGKTVILVGPIATPGWDVASTLSRSLAFGRPLERPLGVSAVAFENHFSDVFATFANRSDVILARPDQIQCSGGSCRYVVGGEALFADDNHLALAALPRFRGTFASALDAALAARRDVR